MVTKEQAIEGGRFHRGNNCTPKRQENWRSNGKCKTWKTRPDEFRLPIKFGMYGYGYLTQDNAHEFHCEDDCPAFQEGAASGRSE